MQARVKFGLIVGLIGLVLNTCVSFAFGFCGPVTALIAGAVAGWLTARAEAAPTKSENAKAGAIAGAIAGALVLIGQLCGVAGTLVLALNTGVTLVGSLPRPGDTGGMVGFWLGGLGAGACFGLFGVMLAAGAGALVGYVSAPTRGAVPPVPPAQTSWPQ